MTLSKSPKMQGVTIKFGGKRDDWKCCFCCHVHTATIFLGIWLILLHILTLSMMAIVLLPTPLSCELANLTNLSPDTNEFLEHLNVSIVIIFSTFAVTWLMVYGAIKGEPSYLKPFICLQLVHFCFSSWTALAFLYNLHDADRLVAESVLIPMCSESLAILLLLLTEILLKAYFIEVVWNCYLYLRLRQLPAQRTFPLIKHESV